MTDWREQLRDFIDEHESLHHSWAGRSVPAILYSDSAFTPSPEEISQFLKEIGYDCDHSR